MEFSGLTSIPDLKYPAWLEEYDVNVTTQNVPVWVNKLEQNTGENHRKLKGQDLSSETGDSREPFRGQLLEIKKNIEAFYVQSVFFFSSCI